MLPGQANPMDESTPRHRPKDDRLEKSGEDGRHDMQTYEYASRHGNPSALFPRREKELSMASTLSEKSNTVPSYEHASRRSPDTQNAIREEFIMKTPSNEFADWCRFTDKYPWLLDDKSDRVLYVNAAVKGINAQDKESQVRAKRCIEKAVFLHLVGGKDQRDRDEFFERFHKRDPETMGAFRSTYEAVEKQCRERLASSAPSVPQQVSLPGDDPRMRHMIHSTNQLNINSSAENAKTRHADAFRHTNEYYGTRSERQEGNPRPSVHSQHGPPISTQDPADTNLQPSIKGASSETAAFEKLDPNYIRRDPRRAGRFFKVGRVFSILEHVEDGRSDERTSDAKWRTKKGDIFILSHIRRLVVVREGHGYCWAVPINTYNGQGVKKSGFSSSDVQAHAIIHDSENDPEALKGEPRLSKKPIEIDRSDGAEPLPKASRINFAKVTTVEHNVRAMALGSVSPHSMPNFENYWKQHLLGQPSR